MDLVTVATCALNNWALDLQGNRDRIVKACEQAKRRRASLLVTPELSITGYGCLDHFLELDLYEQCWEVLQSLLEHPSCQDILLDVGMPVEHHGCYYNCRIICHKRQILLIRPKMSLANDGNFREMRYFTAWPRKSPPLLEDHVLPPSLRKLTGQKTVPFGEAMLETLDTVVAAESCEELFTPDSPHIGMGLRGAEIFTNSSGSHHQLRKLDQRIQLIVGATAKSGGVYLYSNQQGCDGDRLYYDGCALIVVNGKIVAQGSQFSLNDVEVITATVDLQEVRSFRYAPSRRSQADAAPEYPRVTLDHELVNQGDNLNPAIRPSAELQPRYHRPEEEIALGPACWLWDYLRRSRQAGFFVPLSGGIDSCSTAVIVFSMCREVFKAVEQSNEQVIKDMCRICDVPEDWRPASPQDICGKLFATAYMGTESNSSKDTRARAKELAHAIGAYHTDLNIDTIVSAVTTLFTRLFRRELKYKVHGGSSTENLALQNIQARLRMVLAYLLAQTVPFIRGRQGPGGLLVLGSGNVDECLRGYLTKYDCSSADLNPIGAISKVDLKAFIAFARDTFALPCLESFLTATPTAELEPITASYVQSDEADMGITYPELSVFGRLRKVERLGPWGQYLRLLHVWGARGDDAPDASHSNNTNSEPSSDTNTNTNASANDAADTNPHWTPRQIYDKVRHFNFYYGINRHKMTTMTPAYHAEQYSPDDNRYDLRPFLYPSLEWAYAKIERAVAAYEGGLEANVNSKTNTKPNVDVNVSVKVNAK